MTTVPTHDGPIDQATVYELEASRWAAAGRPDHAACFYAATLDHRPGDARVRMMLADCLVRSNQPGAAAAEYLRVASSYAAQRRHAEAMALCYQVLHLDPSQFVYVAVAEVLRGIGAQARVLCARAAEAHLQAGRLADGLHMLRLGAEIDGRNSDVRRRLAQIYLSQHMITEAVANLAEAGRLLLAAGNNAEYVEVAELILRHDPRHLETLRQLPRVYLRVGEAPRAVVKLADLMRVSPGDTIGYETLAHAFAVLGRLPTALSVLERLVGELVSSGRASQAEKILERARGWRLDDLDFIRAVVALRQPKRPPAPPRASRPTTAEGTVVLDITDLVADDTAPMLDLSEEVVELVDGEGTIVLRVQGLSRMGPSRRPPSPPPAPKHGLAPSRTGAPGRLSTPRQLPTPRQGSARRQAAAPSRPAAPRRLELVEVEVDDITLVRSKTSHEGVVSLVLDEDSAELRNETRSSRTAPPRRAQGLARRAAP